MEPTSCPRVRTSPRRTRTPYLPLQLYEFPLTPAPPRAIHGCRRWSGGFKSLADVAFPLVRIVPVSYQVCEGKALGKARKLGNCVGHEVRRQAVWTQRPLVLRYPNPPPNLRFSLQTLAKVKFYFFETSLKKNIITNIIKIITNGHLVSPHPRHHHQWPRRTPNVSIIALAKSRRSMVAMLWQGCSGINLYWERRFLAMLVARRSCSARRGLFAVARGQNFRKDAKDAKKALFFASMRFAKKRHFAAFVGQNQ